MLVRVMGTVLELSGEESVKSDAGIVPADWLAPGESKFLLEIEVVERVAKLGDDRMVVKVVGLPDLGEYL